MFYVYNRTGISNESFHKNWITSFDEFNLGRKENKTKKPNKEVLHNSAISLSLAHPDEWVQFLLSSGTFEMNQVN